MTIKLTEITYPGASAQCLACGSSCFHVIISSCLDPLLFLCAPLHDSLGPSLPSLHLPV